jgi:putative transposase
MNRHAFSIDAFVLLPDHMHCVWTLPRDDRDFAKRWRLIKSYFSRKCDGLYKEIPSESRRKKNEQMVWQRRFWEHLIRDSSDKERHIEYIHYNPVKHGLVKTPKDWAYSSFHSFVHKGIYTNEWGSGCRIDFDDSIGRE